jgi:acyl-CoA synthetase (AMP-forming)/AMP-acid ligase II
MGQIDRGWGLRTVAPELAARYVEHGWWTDETLGEVLDRQLRAHPAVPVTFRSAVRPWRGTYAEVHALALAVAGGLRELGVGSGDVVAFQTPNWLEGAATFYAATFLGAVVVPVVHFYGPKELSYILRQTQVDLLVTADRFGPIDYRAQLDELRGQGVVPERVVTVGEPIAGTTPFRELADAPAITGVASVDPGRPAVIGYTSGTTSDPKGVIHSHRSALAEVRQLADNGPTGLPPALLAAPIGHAIGMLGGLLVPVTKGNPIHLLDHWDPGEVLQLMTAEGLSVSGGVPYFVLSLLDHPDCTPEHHRLMPQMGMGGAPVPGVVTARLASLGIRVTRAYGSTEHPSITGSPPETPDDKAGYTDGRPLPGNEIRLVAADGTDVGPGRPGEILSRGPDLCIGFTDPALLDTAFDPDGWFHTGDVGVLDDDGYLTIVDRTKDIIIRGGENVSALEVEEQILAMPQVAEVAVVAAPDERLGEHACAFVRLVAPGGGSDELDLDEVRRHLEASGLARQKWPEELRFVEDLPRTPSGKVKKFVLRQELRDEHDERSAPDELGA